jgi:hypothetical protein
VLVASIFGVIDALPIELGIQMVILHVRACL